MENVLTVPRVVNEGKISQIYKLILFIGIIVFIIIFLMNNMYNDNDISKYNIKYNNKKCIKMDYMNSNNIKNTQINNAINIKKIILYNLNKSTIPINQIILIDNDNNKTSIQNKNIETHRIGINSSGIEMYFNLCTELMIKTIIIDIDLLSDDVSNILTSQIKVYDKDNNISWNNTNPLSIKNRYITLTMTNSHIIYPHTSNNLTSLMYNESKKEDKLNSILEENTW